MPLTTGNKKHEVLAIIPARGGSKGLPRKNIRDLCGQPLIAYSIQAALKATTIDRVIVSTEDEAIAAIAKEHGAEVPFLRPRQIAGDTALVGAAVQHMAEALGKEGYHPDAIVTLFPTQPFRTPTLIDFLTETLFSGYTSVYTGKPIARHQRSVFAAQTTGEITPIERGLDRSTLHAGTYYRRSGLFMGSLTGVDIHLHPYLHMLTDPICWIDIDYLADFLLAEAIIERGLFDFTGPHTP
jgi:CMP-N-acetylneuraminic acid synthetase